MRYLKLASDKNPDNDYIELNDFNGFLCTSFQSIGISRKLEFLAIKNRQFVVSNKPNFKKYSLTVEILSKYSEYEAKHRELISFLDRNKKSGFRLYYRPYDGMDLRYCLCDIETSQKVEKLQPVLLTLSQGSLWFGEEKKETTSQKEEEKDNLFSFNEEEFDGEKYFSANFVLDEKINNYYCIEFYNGVVAETSIVNNSYNEIPLNIRIMGNCVNPVVSLFRKGENNPIKKVQIFANVDNNHYIEIKSGIAENGIWYVNNNTGAKIEYSELVNNFFGSPYIYIDNGEYIIKVEDDGKNVCLTDIFYQEEYNE